MTVPFRFVHLFLLIGSLQSSQLMASNGKVACCVLWTALGTGHRQLLLVSDSLTTASSRRDAPVQASLCHTAQLSSFAVDARGQYTSTPNVLAGTKLTSLHGVCPKLYQLVLF